MQSDDVPGGGPSDEARLRQGRTSELTYIPVKTITRPLYSGKEHYFVECEVVRSESLGLKWWPQALRDFAFSAAAHQRREEPPPVNLRSGDAVVPSDASDRHQKMFKPL